MLNQISDLLQDEMAIFDLDIGGPVNIENDNNGCKTAIEMLFDAYNNVSVTK